MLNISFYLNILRIQLKHIFITVHILGINNKLAKTSKYLLLNKISLIISNLSSKDVKYIIKQIKIDTNIIKMYFLLYPHNIEIRTAGTKHNTQYIFYYINL